MSDGYFHIFLTKESNFNVSEISVDPSSALIVSVTNTGVDSRVGSYYKLPFFFFFFLAFSIAMQNYFIQVIWNYINDKKYTP